MTSQNLPANPPAPDPTARRGQGLMEFALILPLLLLLILGAIETGRMLAIFSSLSSASKMAVRYGAVAGDYDVFTAGDQPFYNNCNGIRATARRAALFVPLEDAGISIRYERGVGTITQTIGLCAPGAVTPTVALTSTAPITILDGDRMVISITATYRPIVPIVPLPEVPMTFAAARTIFTVIIGPTPTLPPRSDLLVEKGVVDGLNIFPDDPLGYVITVTNVSGGDAVSIIFTDTLPIQIRKYPEQTGNPGVRWEPPPLWDCADPPNPQTYPILIRCEYLLPLGAGESVVLPITVTAPTTPGITITNTVIAYSAVTETITSNNIATATTTLVTGADLIVTKSASPTFTLNSLSGWVYGGQPLTYTLTAYNNGPEVKSLNGGPSNKIIVTDTLPSGAQLIRIPSSADWDCVGTTQIVCTTRNGTPDLGVGASLSPITIVITVPMSADGTPLVNVGVIAPKSGSATQDPKPRNNTVTLTNTISLAADLAITKTVAGATPSGGGYLIDGGQPFSYTVLVTNIAGARASGIVVTDTLGMSGGSYAAAGTNWSCSPSGGTTGGQVVCSLSGSLSPGQTSTPLIFTVVPAAATTLANTAVVGSPQSDPDTTNNTAVAPSVSVNNCDINVASAPHTLVSSSPANVQTDPSNTNKYYSTVTVQLRNGCDSHAPVTFTQTVTLTSNRGTSIDTINVVGGSGPISTTTTGTITFRVSSNTAGNSVYTASANGGSASGNSAGVTYFDCITGSAGISGVGNSNVAFLYTNNAGFPLRLISMSLIWPYQNPRTLNSVVFDSATIWSGSSSANPFVASSFLGPDTDRDVGNGLFKNLTLNFSYNVSSGSGVKSFDLTTTWDDTSGGGRQCTITTTVTR
jgi:uncharacterized repeat protein (TIGR01451 family)